MSNIKTQRVPLVGSLINRNANPSSFNTKDQQFINCFPEIVSNTISGSSLAYLYKRFGYGASAIANAASGSYGHVTWSGKADGSAPALLSFLKSGGTNTMVFNSTTQVGGDIGTTNACMSLTETVVSGVSNLVGTFLNSGTGLAEGWFFPEGGAWTKITDGDFPPNIGTPEPLSFASGPAHMDGYAFWMTTNGKIWNSDLNSVSAYTASSFITDSSYPDAGVGIARYKNLIFALGTKSGSFYQNVGNTPLSPLAIIPSATFRVGAVASSSASKFVRIMNVGDTVYWIGQDAESGRFGIYRLNGYAPEKISTGFVDKYIIDPGLNTMHICGAFSMFGLAHVMFDFGITTTGTGMTICFCIDTKQWWLFSPGISNSYPLAIEGNARSSSFCANGGASQTKTFSSGPTTFTDDSGTYTQTVQTENMDMGTMRRKSWLAARVVGDIQSATSRVNISWSDDDYATFSTPVSIDMSSLADVGSGISRLGQSRRRAWKLTHSDNTPNRMEALELTYSIDED